MHDFQREHTGLTGLTGFISRAVDKVAGDCKLQSSLFNHSREEILMSRMSERVKTAPKPLEEYFKSTRPAHCVLQYK